MKTKDSIQFQIEGPEKYVLSDQEIKVWGRCNYWQLQEHKIKPNLGCGVENTSSILLLLLDIEYYVHKEQ